MPVPSFNPTQTSDFFKLSEAVYDPSVTQVGEWTRMSEADAIKHSITTKLQKDSISFKSAIFENLAGDKVVAFAGTETSPFKDLMLDAKTDVVQGLGFKDAQYQQAANLGRDVNSAFPNSKVTFTGHSLGGGLATTASAVTGRPAVTINPAAVHDNTLRREGVNPETFKTKAQNGQVTRYVVDGEILDRVQSAPLITEAQGKKVSLYPPNSPNTFSKHTMTVATEALSAGLPPPTSKTKGIAGCLGKMVAGVALEVGLEYGAEALLRAVQVGVLEANKKPPAPPPAKKAVTVTHQIKHASLFAALVGAAVGALLATAAAVTAVAVVGATGGAALAVGVVAMVAVGPLIGKASSAVTNFIDSFFPADDGPVATGSPNVFVENLKSARAKDDTVACTKHSPPPAIAQGSDSVFINNQPAVRLEDKTVCGAPIKQGASTVFIGGGTTTVMEIGSEFSFWETALIMGVEFLIPPTKGMFSAIAKAPKMLAKAIPNVIKGIVKGAKTAFSSATGKLGGKAFVNALKKGAVGLKSALAGLCNLKKPTSPARSKSTNPSNGHSTIGCAIGNPVDPIKGDVIKEHTDFSFGQTIPLTFSRSYRSSNQEKGLLGQGWWDSFSEHLIIDKEKHQVTLNAGNGLVVTFDVPAHTHRVFNRRYPHLHLAISPQGYVIKNTESGLFHYYHYIANGRASLVSIVDRDKNNIRLLQNEAGQPYKIQHSDGVHLQLEYQQGFLHKVYRTDFTGKPVLIAKYSQDKALLVSAWSKGKTDHKITYNQQRLMQSISYHDNSTVSYQYDQYGQCTKMRGSDDYHHWDFEYHEQAQQNAARDAKHNIWIFHYNDEQQVVKEISPTGSEHLFEYDRYGLLISETDALNNQTLYHHDAWSGQLLQIEDSLGRLTSITYDEDFEQVEKIVSVEGETQFTYHNHKLVGIQYPDKTHQSYQYDSAGNLLNVEKDTLENRQFAYDKNNRLIKASDWLQQEQKYSYTEHDQLSQIITPRQNLWKYNYDQENRLYQVTDPLNHTEQTHYTQGHQPSIFIDGNEHKQQIKYGAFDLPSQQVDAEGNITRFEYDKIHQSISKVTNASGQQWCFEYDSVGNLIKETDYNGHVTSYTYTLLGQLASKTSATDDTIRYFYDAAGRMTQKHTNEGASIYDWDDQDRLINLKTPSSTLEYQYGDRGQLSQESQNGHIIRYEYDKLGHRKARHIQASPWHPESDTQSTQYQYNANGQLIQITLPEQKPLELHYDADGNLIQQQNEVGYINVQHIDPKGRIGWQRIGKDDTPEYRENFQKDLNEPQFAFVKRDYQYDAVDNLLSCRSSHDTAQWAYNKNNQVTQEQSRHHTQSYQYTPQLAVQSFAQKGGQETLQAYHYSQSGQLTRQQSNENDNHHYQYDVNGRLTKKVIERNGFRTTEQRYHWNSEDQLIKVITKNEQHIHYQYDGFGRRILKHNSNTNETTHILWDGNTIAQEITISPKNKGKKEADEQQIDTTHWYFMPNSFTPLAQQVQSNTARDKLQQNELYTSYIATDHMGTVKELFSPQGDLVWRNKNSLWGKPNGQLENPNHSPEVDCSLGFQGQYFDKDTGLHYNFHRYYDAEMGQYISPDPIGLLGGLHPQAYVHNPIGWVDPFGLAKCKSSALDKSLSEFKSSKFYINGINILLDRKGMKHILERHHPKYWNGTTKAKQSFFPKNMTINEIESTILEVLKQNRSRVANIGSNSMGSMKGVVNGIEYQLGLNKGRVGQFFGVF